MPRRQKTRPAWEKICNAQLEGRVLVIAHGVILSTLLAHRLPQITYQATEPVYLRPCALSELHVPGRLYPSE